MLEQVHSRLGESQAARGSTEELDAELRFEGLNLPPRRGLAHPKNPGGPRKRPLGGRGDEHLKAVPVELNGHGSVHSHMHI